MAGLTKLDIHKELSNLRRRFSQIESLVADQDAPEARPAPETDLNAVVSDLTYSLITSNASLAGNADIVLNYAKVFTKNVYLTPQEIQVTSLVRAGHQTKDISELLEISINAVHFHRKNIRAKLGLKHENINLRSYLLTLSNL